MSDCHYHHMAVRLSTFYFVNVHPLCSPHAPPLFGKQKQCKLKTKRLERKKNKRNTLTFVSSHLISFHLDLALALARLDFARPCAV